jgi:hypothetical protein
MRVGQIMRLISLKDTGNGHGGVVSEMRIGHTYKILNVSPNGCCEAKNTNRSYDTNSWTFGQKDFAPTDESYTEPKMLEPGTIVGVKFYKMSEFEKQHGLENGMIAKVIKHSEYEIQLLFFVYPSVLSFNMLPLPECEVIE